MVPPPPFGRWDCGRCGYDRKPQAVAGFEELGRCRPASPYGRSLSVPYCVGTSCKAAYTAAASNAATRLPEAIVSRRALRRRRAVRTSSGADRSGGLLTRGAARWPPRAARACQWADTSVRRISVSADESIEAIPEQYSQASTLPMPRDRRNADLHRCPGPHCSRSLRGDDVTVRRGLTPNAVSTRASLSASRVPAGERALMGA
jgi:hypothetical protein